MLPIIDVSPLVAGRGDRASSVRDLGAACREHGFFYASNHGIDPELQRRLEDASRKFFALPLEQKNAIRMELGGRAWRGFFPVGGELTSGIPDLKEGLYLGTELPAGDPRPLHGPNLFPAQVPDLRSAVLDWMTALTELGHALMSGIAESLGLAPDHFRVNWMQDPITLFRVFHYPPDSGDRGQWGVGEHTDYGVLTMLLQDDVGGLQVKSRGTWLEAPPIPGTFVCNLGDMLERATGGFYKSTPHRVLNTSGRDRYSFPFFFDPSWDARIAALPIAADDAHERWDGTSVHAFEGTYGEYLMGKVAKVFPELGAVL